MNEILTKINEHGHEEERDTSQDTTYLDTCTSSID